MGERETEGGSVGGRERGQIVPLREATAERIREVGKQRITA